jgi:hypothetical protein
VSGDRGEAFLARWSRRKQAEPEAREREDARVAETLPAAARPEPAAPVPAVGPPPADLPPPESLTPASDFTRFMRADVPAASRNAALKTLFTDPHFNVMDGLDTYIDDYTKPDPIPAAMLRDLAQSRMLRLFDDEEEPAAKAGSPDAGPAIAASADEEAAAPESMPAVRTATALPSAVGATQNPLPLEAAAASGADAVCPGAGRIVPGD